MSPWLSILCCTFPYDPNHLANHKNCPGTSIQIVATFAFFSFKFLGFIRHEPRPQDKKIRRRKKNTAYLGIVRHVLLIKPRYIVYVEVLTIHSNSALLGSLPKGVIYTARKRTSFACFEHGVAAPAVVS